MIGAAELLAAYASGYFPMAESRNSKQLRWYMPELRGVLPLEDFHVPHSLKKALKRAPFTLSCDRAFLEVIQACASSRADTWINDTIIGLYTELHTNGFAHSIECWQDEKLVGGLYGVALGGAFFGESMFSHVSNASKAALVELVSRLNAAGYVLLDAQYVNDHLKQFGIVEIPREEYSRRLEDALRVTISAEAWISNK